MGDAEKHRETFMVCESPRQFAENNRTAFADARWFRLRNRDVRKAENWEAAEPDFIRYLMTWENS